MLRALDLALLRLLRTRGHSPAIERAVLSYTRLGENGAIWFAIAAAGGMADAGRRPVYARAAWAANAVASSASSSL